MKPDYEFGNIKFYNADCMELMNSKPNNHWDLAIVDPPYGIDVGNMNMGKGSSIETGKLSKSCWDKNQPNKLYFDNLLKVSTNTIIWGGNYFDLPPTKCFLIWDKMDYNSDFASAELAWTSFNKVVKTYRHSRNTKEKRIHPTQKPIDLYRWLLQNYAENGDTIIDTHGGSMSSAIACYEEGFELDICEIDEDYFDKAIERFINHTKQQKLFE